MTTHKGNANRRVFPLLYATGGAATLAVALVLFQGAGNLSAAPAIPKGMEYTSEGYGGFVPVGKTPATPALEPLSVARATYREGRYRDAESAAMRVASAAAGNPTANAPTGVSSAASRKRRAEARHLMAFAAARRKDYALAREQFAQAEWEAAGLPRTLTDPNRPEEIIPTLAEDSAYQRAVCAAGMGDKAVATGEFIAFLGKYPESPLVHASMRRIARLNNGDIPKEAEAVWESSRAIASSRAKERRRQQAFCGPDCLAELLRRAGKGTPGRDDLAKELKTGEDGTTLAALEASAKRHGLPEAQGVQMTSEGLRKVLEESDRPVLVLVQPQHFVLVEGIASDGTVTVWDPNAKAVGQPGRRTSSAAEWRLGWEGCGGFALLTK